MDFQDFVNGNKTLLIAPAGYGKTHTIVECLKYTIGNQLILTHTHAGIASIREKIKKEGIPSQAYTLETISGFIQKYVHSFYIGDDIPEQDDAKLYHPFLLEKALKLFQARIVQKVFTSSHTGLFVDEYQDCTISQHEIIMLLSTILPTHILGDPLQGIFDFNGDAVCMDTVLSEFTRFPDLDMPYRWYQHQKNDLGDILKQARYSLLNSIPINLKNINKDAGLYVIPINDGGILKGNEEYIKNLNRIISNRKNNVDFESLLIIVPEYSQLNSSDQMINQGDITHRNKIKARIDFAGALTLLEAIDDKMFYSLAREADNLISGMRKIRKKTKRLRDGIIDKFFAESSLNAWLKDDSWINKRGATDKIKSENAHKLFDSFFDLPDTLKLSKILLEIKNGLKIRNKRDEVFRSFISVLKLAASEKITVYEAMKKNRNTIRHIGRKVFGKCIGTTLLTKGLEFDTVVILDAHKFDCPKHLYVALTRCCKNLIIFSAKTSLAPYRQ